MDTNTSKGRRHVARIGALAMLAAGLTAATAVPAMADGFTQGNSVPTIDMTANTMTITPTDTGSDTQTLIATVFDYDTPTDLKDVVLCLAASGTSNCSTPNNQTNFTLTYTASGTTARASGQEGNMSHKDQNVITIINPIGRAANHHFFPPFLSHKASSMRVSAARS